MMAEKLPRTDYTMPAARATVHAIDPEGLVEQCLAGRASAYQELYSRYADAMFNTCLRILRDHHLAEDALQEAFTNAFKHLASFDGKATFGAWLKRIVINQCFRKRKQAQPEFAADPQLLAETTQEGTLHEPVFIDAGDTTETIEAIERALNELPEGYRTVVQLYLFEGYDHQEIAEILGISPNTSKTQYMRAKKRLRETLSTQAQ